MRAIAWAYHDGLITHAEADAEMLSVGNVMHHTDRRLVVDALTKQAGLTGVTRVDDLMNAIKASDPGHVGVLTPTWPAPAVGLVWDSATNRWAKALATLPVSVPTVPTSTAPALPPPDTGRHGLPDILAFMAVSDLKLGTNLTLQEISDLRYDLGQCTTTDVNRAATQLGVPVTAGSPQQTTDDIIQEALKRSGHMPAPPVVPATAAAYSSALSNFVSNNTMTPAEVTAVVNHVPHLSDVELQGLYNLMGGVGNLSSTVGRSINESAVIRVVYIATSRPTPPVAATPPPPVAAAGTPSSPAALGAPPPPAIALSPNIINHLRDLVGGKTLAPSHIQDVSDYLDLMSKSDLKEVSDWIGGPPLRTSYLSSTTAQYNKLMAHINQVHAANTAALAAAAPVTTTTTAPTTTPAAPTAGGPPYPQPGPPPRPGLVWNTMTGRWRRPGAYEPPHPQIHAVAPYDDPTASGGGYGNSNSGVLGTPTSPTTIDHNAVKSYPDTIGSLAATGFVPNATPLTYDHTASGYKVKVVWLNGAPAIGQPGSYSVCIYDASDNLVTSYDSGAARGAAYVEKRAIQVAHWLDAELKKAAAPAAGPANHLAQFAADYASPGKVPFMANDPTDWGTAANRAKVEGFLKATFPKLIGTQQHSPHGGMDTIEHTMNIVNPLNLRTSGLSDKDAEILRLGMVFHDVGKQYDPLDHEHPRKSAKDAEPLLWQFGLTPKEAQDALAVIKWHDAYGDALKAGGSDRDAKKIAKLAYEYADDKLPPGPRMAEALRINNLLLRAWQSDLSTIPGLTSKPVPGRPDIAVSGSIDVDAVGPPFESKIAAEIAKLSTPPASLPLPAKPATPAVGTAAPYLVASGCEWGELVQRTDNLPIGPQVPYNSTVTPPKEVYDEAHAHPDLNYARAFNMAYDGPTGQIITVSHGVVDDRVAAKILNTGLRPGSSGDNAYGHGIYCFLNGAGEMGSGYGQYAPIVQAEVHTGRVIDHKELENTVMPQWAAANPAEARKLGRGINNGKLAAAALWAGYSSIMTPYTNGNNEPIIIVLDPSRFRITTVSDSKGKKYAGKTLNTNAGPVTFPKLTKDEIAVPTSDPGYVPVSRGRPKGWSGPPRTT